MWNWHFANAVEVNQRNEMLHFCKSENIHTIFLQISYDFKTAKNGQIICQLHHIKELRSFLTEAHNLKINIEALDGARYLALTPWHPYVLSQVEALMQFNQQGQSQEQFDGLHYDIEPYSLPAWQQGQKESISLQYLTLIARMGEKLRKSGSKMTLGLSIPFWFEEPGDDGIINVNLTWNKQLKALSYHLLDLVDEIAIMDYRTAAQGPNGAIRHAQDEVQYADKVRKKVWVGLETGKVQGDPPSISFFGHPVSDLEKVSTEITQAFQNNKSFQGIAIHYYEPYKALLERQGK